MEEPGPGQEARAARSDSGAHARNGNRRSLVEAKENNFLAAVARQNAVGAAAGRSGEAQPGDCRKPTIGLGLRRSVHRRISRHGIQRAKKPKAGCATSWESCARARFCCRARDALSRWPPAPSINGLGAVETRLDDWIFESNYAARQLKEQFRVVALEGFGLSEHPQATAAAGAIVHYLRETSAIGARKPEDTLGRSVAASRRHRASSTWTASPTTSSRTR